MDNAFQRWPRGGSPVWLTGAVGQILADEFFDPAPVTVSIAGSAGVGIEAVGVLKSVRLLQGAAGVGVEAAGVLKAIRLLQGSAGFGISVDGTLITIPVVLPATARVTVRRVNSAIGTVRRAATATASVRSVGASVSASVRRVTECRAARIRAVNSATARLEVVR